MDKSFRISTNPEDMQINFIHSYLSGESYWAKGRSRKDVEISMANSLCFGLFEGSRQVGFGRVATDYVVFAWLMDLFIDPVYRGRGLGKYLVEAILEHDDLKGVHGIGLRTEDAQELYSKYGFGAIPEPGSWMFKKNRP